MPGQTTVEEKLLTKLQKWWRIAGTAYDEWSTQGKEDLNFYFGDQWDSDDLKVLQDDGRPALTFNRIRTPINLVSGHERQNRRDMKVLNKKGGSRVMAEVLTKLLKDVMDTRNGTHEKSMAFLKGIITARGYLKINLDFTEDIVRGNIIVEEVSPFRVYPDPFFEKYDMRDGIFVFIASWLPKDKIEQTFPEKKTELEDLTVMEFDKQVITIGDKYREGGSETSASDIQEYKYRVKECWWIDHQKVTYVIDVRNGKVRDATEWNKARLKIALKIFPYMKMLERSKPVLHLTTYVGQVILQDIEDPFNGITDFPIVPYFAYFIEGKWRSLVTDLKDPQQEINKRRSQCLHHLNLSANSGWIGDEDALADWNDLEEDGSASGLILKVRKGRNLKRIEPAQLSDGHLILAQQADNDIKIISGVNSDLLGLTPQHNESGIAMQLRHRQGNIVIESLFDNLRLTEQTLGKRLIDFIQRSGAYSQEEMVSIIIDGKPEDIKVNEKIANEFGAIKRIQNNLSIGKYEVTVSTSPETPTIRLANLGTMLELVKIGLPVPIDMIVEQMDFPRREEVLRRLKKGQEEGPKESKEQMEGRLKEREIMVKAAIEREKIAIDAQVKREEIAMKREVELLKLAEKKQARLTV